MFAFWSDLAANYPIISIEDGLAEGDERKLMDESISHVKDLVGTVRKIFPDLA